MYPRVIHVIPHEDFTLTLTFANQETRVFDVKPYLEKGVFRELQDLAIFQSVRVWMGSVQWIHHQDFCPDTLYEESTPIEESPEHP
jgi:hypothetical protein